MVATLLNQSSKIRIGGIKFSEELVHITVRHHAPAASLVEPLLHRIAEEQITIPFLCSSRNTKGSTTNFCIASSDLPTLECLCKEPLFKKMHPLLLPAVGLCTVFPHRNSLGFIGKVVEILGSAGFPLHSFSTSISALAFTTDFHILDELGHQLESVFVLPENHAPFRQQFQVRQLPQ